MSINLQQKHDFRKIWSRIGIQKVKNYFHLIKRGYQIQSKLTFRGITYACTTERIFYRQPFKYVQQNIFEKILSGICSSTHLHASLGTFCVQISQLFAAQ